MLDNCEIQKQIRCVMILQLNDYVHPCKDDILKQRLMELQRFTNQLTH